MRSIASGVIVLALGLAGAGGVVAQSRVILPTQGSAGSRAAPGSSDAFFSSSGPAGASGRPVKSPTGGGTAPAGTGFSSPGRAGAAGDSSRPQGFHTSPAQSQEIRLSGSGSEVETPIVIRPE